MSRALTFDIEEKKEKKERREAPPPPGRRRPPTSADGLMDGGETPRAGQPGLRPSLDDLEVVQDGHDVLRHEDVAGVHGHAGHGDQQGVWRGRSQGEHTTSDGSISD